MRGISNLKRSGFPIGQTPSKRKRRPLRACHPGLGGRLAARPCRCRLPSRYPKTVGSAAKPLLPRRRHISSDSSRCSLRSVAAQSTSRPKMTARSSSVSSIKPALATKPPSSISWRVRSRRFTIQARLSSRAIFACRRCRAAVARRSAERVVTIFPASGSRALKERRAALPPTLLRRCILRLHRVQQRAGELVDRQRIGIGSDHQFAELAQLLFPKLPGPVAKRLQFGIEIAWFAHRIVLDCAERTDQISLQSISGNALKSHGIAQSRDR